MIIYLLILVGLILFEIKLDKTNYNEHFDVKQTNCIKGLFTLIIFLSHFNSYAYLKSTGLNTIYLNFFKYISQLMVVPFFFYSGYSICYSIVHKQNYIDKFPKNRLLKVILQFDVAVFMFLLMNIMLHNSYDIKIVVLSFTGWESIGNSNWFIFTLISLYIITYIVFKIRKSKVDLNSVVFITVLTIILIMLLKLKKEPWWYNILLSYPFGMLVFIYKNKIFKILKAHYFKCFMCLALIFLILFRYRDNFIIYELMACVFSTLLLILTYKLKIFNKYLSFLGNYSFEIFILQRIPDIIFSKFLLQQPIIWCSVIFLITIIMAMLFKKIMSYVYKIVLS